MHREFLILGEMIKKRFWALMYAPLKMVSGCIRKDQTIWIFRQYSGQNIRIAQDTFLNGSTPVFRN